MVDAMHKVPFTAAEFVSVCETLQDLPDQNGEEDWARLLSMLTHLQDGGIDILVFLVGSSSAELLQSPLFEILVGKSAPTKPPTKFKSADAALVELDFTPNEFLAVCTKVDEHDTDGWTAEERDTTLGLPKMLDELAQRQVNILDFLSSEDTDSKLQDCALLALILHTAIGSNKQVFVDSAAVRTAITKPFGFADIRHVPPYPPSSCGLDFDENQFLEWCKAAENDISLFSYAEPEALLSFFVLHKRIHDLGTTGHFAVDFLAGREPVEGSPGSKIFKHLVNALYDVQAHFSCDLFFAHVASDGDGANFLTTYWPTDAPPHLQTDLLTREQASDLVDSLPKVDVAAISKDDMKCMHCWADFDEVEEGVNNEPVQLPCDNRHLLGRDCLIEILSSVGPLCPLCRVDIVAMVPPVADISGQAGSV